MPTSRWLARTKLLTWKALLLSIKSTEVSSTWIKVTATHPKAATIKCAGQVNSSEGRAYRRHPSPTITPCQSKAAPPVIPWWCELPRRTRTIRALTTLRMPPAHRRHKDKSLSTLLEGLMEAHLLKSNRARLRLTRGSNRCRRIILLTRELAVRIIRPLSCRSNSARLPKTRQRTLNRRLCKRWCRPNLEAGQARFRQTRLIQIDSNEADDLKEMKTIL